MIRLHRSIIVSLLAAVFMASCAGSQTAATLDEIETCLQQHPDSALTTIRAIDTTTLTSRSLRARYALLYAMALDKNWIDTTDVGVVMPAVDYYAKHGTADEKMKAYYYLGRIHANQGDNNGAILAYTLAEDASKESKDESFKGVLDMSLSWLYSHVHQIDVALEYAYRGLECFEVSGDTLHSSLIPGRLAMLYQEKKEWRIADSLYQLSLQLAARDTMSMALYLSHFASMKVIQPEADPQGAISLLKRRWSEYKKPLTLRDYGVYAYASALLGDNKTCDDILAIIYRQPENRRKETHFMEYRIARHRGDYPLAIEQFNASFNDQNERVDQLLNRSINQTLEEYYEDQVDESKRQAQTQRLTFVIILLVLLLVIGSVILAFVRKRNRERQEAEQLIRLAEESARMMQESNAQLFKDRFAVIGDLCKTYLRTENSGENYQKDAVYRRVQDILSNISSDDRLHAQFEEQINRDYFNIIDHLKADLGEMSPTDERFLCYTIAGFDSTTISSILGLSMSNVYTKKSRLKDRIRQLDSPYKEQYLQVI